MSTKGTYTVALLVKTLNRNQIYTHRNQGNGYLWWGMTGRWHRGSVCVFNAQFLDFREGVLSLWKFIQLFSYSIWVYLYIYICIYSCCKISEKSSWIQVKLKSTVLSKAEAIIPPASNTRSTWRHWRVQFLGTEWDQKHSRSSKVSKLDSLTKVCNTRGAWVSSLLMRGEAQAS